MNEMYKTIIEKYEKDGYESAKKSFMDLVNADRSDDEKDDVILSYITMAKLAFVNKDNEMAEKLLRLDSKFGNSSEKRQLAGKVAKPHAKTNKADEPRDKPEQDNSVNVKNLFGIEFVELTPNVYVSRKTISRDDVKRIGKPDNTKRGSWYEGYAFCVNLSNMDPLFKTKTTCSQYNFRLPTKEEFLNVIDCHKKKVIQLEPPSVYEWTLTSGHGNNNIAINCMSDVLDLPNSGEQNEIRFNTAFRVIMEPKH